LGVPVSEDQRKAPPAWQVGLIAFVMGAGWFILIGENFVAKPIEPFWITVAVGSCWAALAFVLFVKWSSGPAWNEWHRFSAAVCATLACIAAPYLSIMGWSKIDVVGELIFDLTALIALVALLAKFGIERT
jgi:hypothetical protein